MPHAGPSVPSEGGGWPHRLALLTICATLLLIVAGAPEKDQKSRTGWEATLEHLLGELPLAQAVRITCALTGARRKAVYEHALAAAEQRKE